MSPNRALKALPKVTPPVELSSRLRVLASREALRRRRRATLGALATHLAEEAALLFNNLMRPYAVPCAGGLVSALFLFSLVAPSLAGAGGRNLSSDIPTALLTEATLESSFSFSLSAEDGVVDLSIDEQGRVSGYSIPKGQAWASDPALVRSLENTLLCTKFKPATFFGVPASAKARITLRRSAVDVRG